MKTKLTLLTLLPVLMLASCGDGKEIKDEAKIKELKDSISEKAKEVKNYELVIKTSSDSYDKDEQKTITTKGTSTFMANDKNEFYLKSSATRGNEKSESTIYLVNNEEYQQVMYVSAFNPDSNKDDITVYGYKGNEMTFAFATMYFLVPQSYYSLFNDPNSFDLSKTAIANGEIKRDYDQETKYYSKGDGNLTIKAEAKIKGEVNKEENEYPCSISYTISYDKYALKTVKINQESNKGSKSKTEIKMNIKDNLEIKLPDGWKDLINKETPEDNSQN